jgi:Mce-associated membrane protein
MVNSRDKEVAMPSFRRRASATDSDQGKVAEEASATTPDALSLAEEAEAEAAEAEAIAAAARARARAIRLRREAESAAAAKAEEAAKADKADDGAADDTAAAAADADKADEPDETGGAADTGNALTATEPADDTAEPVEAPAKRRWGLVVKIVAMTLASLLTLALLAFSGWTFVQHRKADEQNRMNAEYTAAGRQAVVTLMSLDFNKAQDDVKRIIDNATGDFKKDFENQAQDFIKVAQDSKVVTDVTVTATAVESMDKDKAVVLVAATSRVTNSAGAKAEPRAWRLSVNLQREGGQIKMSKVEFVP